MSSSLQISSRPLYKPGPVQASPMVEGRPAETRPIVPHHVFNELLKGALHGKLTYLPSPPSLRSSVPSHTANESPLASKTQPLLVY